MSFLNSHQEYCYIPFRIHISESVQAGVVIHPHPERIGMVEVIVAMQQELLYIPGDDEWSLTVVCHLMQSCAAFTQVMLIWIGASHRQQFGASTHFLQPVHHVQCTGRRATRLRGHPRYGLKYFHCILMHYLIMLCCKGPP